MSAQKNNPLHGIKLEQIVNDLQKHYGWEYMGYQINIRCFTHDPSVKSSLKFLRRTPWARTKVEQMYLKMLKNTSLRKSL
ncbi:VF530 family protein [Psychroserpens sp. MEBiC05023]